MARVLRLVATDLDGTLLHSDGTVTERSRDVLRAVEDLGVVVVFVTGRPIRWMEPLWPHVGDHGLAICSNGGIVYDVPSRSVVEARAIPREVGPRGRVADPARGARGRGSPWSAQRAAGARRASRRGRTNRWPRSTTGRSRTSTPTTWSSCSRCTSTYPRPTTGPASSRRSATWSPPRGRHSERSSRCPVPTSPRPRRWRKVCAERGITPDQVLAFGDMPNDVAMLSWAGAVLRDGRRAPAGP